MRHCLEKDPEGRFQSARDLAFHLETALSESESSAAIAAQRSRTVPTGWLIAGLAILAVVGAAWWNRGEPQPDHRQVSFLRLTDFAGLEESPAFSPDGKSVAFVSDSTGSRADLDSSGGGRTTAGDYS